MKQSIFRPNNDDLRPTPKTRKAEKRSAFRHLYHPHRTSIALPKFIAKAKSTLSKRTGHRPLVNKIDMGFDSRLYPSPSLRAQRSNPVFFGVRKKVWIAAPASPARDDEFDGSVAMTAGKRSSQSAL
jgi:hypothetical protein